MIKSVLPAPGPDTVVLMCGPPPMVKFACKANLDALGYDKNDQLCF
jgi:cytochrome-b5 reductase